MEPQSRTEIASFVIRFIGEHNQDETEHGRAQYRGSIRHVQSDQEHAFTQWEDAVKFIQRYIPLDDSIETGASNATKR